MTDATLVAEVETRLRGRFAPRALHIVDESHLHLGHAGAQSGRHLRIRISADELDQLPRIAAHRAIYGALSDLMTSKIHALAIELSA